METIRVLIADDHTLFREGVQAILKGAPDVDAVGEASTGQEAIQQAGQVSPDVILMDIQMPDMNGIEATRISVSSWSPCLKMTISCSPPCAPGPGATF
jgi:DNA-binding NarL/FixJ family response regulator